MKIRISNRFEWNFHPYLFNELNPFQFQENLLEPIKNKQGLTVLEAFRNILKRSKRIPQKILRLGRGLGTAVEHPPHDQEVVGLNPAGFLGFFLRFQHC